MTKSNEKTSIKDEFQKAPISDQRLIRRLIITATILDNQAGKSIPNACPDWATTKATYNFFDNPKITSHAILASHYANTIERMQKYPYVLLIQDTSILDFNTHKCTKGLGPYTKDAHTLGLLMHSVLAVSPCGIPLGLLYQDIWSRENYPYRKRTLRQRLPIEDKESYKWIKAMDGSLKMVPDSIKTISVSDRESDIFEFFQNAIQREEHLVIRAFHNRRVTDEEYQHLFEQVRNTPEKGSCFVDIPRKPEQKQPPRKAKLNIRFCPITICAPSKKSGEALRLYAIFAQEIDAPGGEEPIEWLLLTTIPVASMSEAIQKIEWYRERWKIERFHYTLKSGCHIEELQLETSQRLNNAIALYSIIAWRLLWLTYQARVTPTLSCEIVLEAQEWQALYCVVNRKKTLPSKPPTLQEAVRLLARLGGFLGRKNDGEPGVKVLWRGLQRLNDGMMFLELTNSYPTPSNDVGNE